MYFKSTVEEIAENNAKYPPLSALRCLLESVFSMLGKPELEVVCTVGTDSEGLGYNAFYLHPVATVVEHMAEQDAQVPDTPWVVISMSNNIPPVVDLGTVFDDVDFFVHMNVGEIEFRDEHHTLDDVTWAVKDTLEHLLMPEEEVNRLLRHYAHEEERRAQSLKGSAGFVDTPAIWKGN